MQKIDKILLQNQISQQVLANQPLSLKKVSTGYWTRQETANQEIILDSPTRKSTEFGAESSATSKILNNYRQKKKLQANILKSYGTVQNP